jgi:hypothetical protein
MTLLRRGGIFSANGFANRPVIREQMKKCVSS